MLCPKCGAKNPSLTSKCLSCGGPLPISGPPTAPTAIISNTFTSRTSGMGNLSQMPPVSIASRIPGVFVVVAGLLVLVGIFLPWIRFNSVSSEIPGFGEITFNFNDISGWDMATAHGLTDAQGASTVEKYAVLTIIGGILTLVAALWALVTPSMRFAWAAAAIGGFLAIVGCIWAYRDVNDFVYAFSSADNSCDYGAGLYMGMIGGIVGLITGMYAFWRSADASY